VTVDSVDLSEGRTDTIADIDTGRDGRVHQPDGAAGVVIVTGKRQTIAVQVADWTTLCSVAGELHVLDDRGEILAWRGGFLRLRQPDGAEG
jgi:hypothetical protein